MKSFKQYLNDGAKLKKNPKNAPIWQKRDTWRESAEEKYCCVTALEKGLKQLDKHDYDSINKLMMDISKKYNITGKDLHNDFVSRHGKTPDNWIKQNLKEDLRKWFKQKWVRMDTKGNIKGHCARDPGEGKPKCLPQARAHALGKEGRAAAAQRKRREDPNPERRGSPINVRTESAAAAIAAAIAISKKKSGNYDSKGFRKTAYKNPNSPLRKSNAEREKERE
jgi:hypothetical protein